MRAAFLLLALAASPLVDAQTMLDQQQRLIDIHCLLLDLPAMEAPAALRAFQVSVGVEGIAVPPIDGMTGGRRQITASDHTPLFPRPRVSLGLPAPAGFRAFVGLAYIPPLSIASVTTHDVGGEAGIALARGPLAAGLRAHVVYAFSRAPVTDPATRDSLETFAYGADVSAGYRIEEAWMSFTPYAGLGVTHTHGRFRVTSDGVVLTSDDTVPSLAAGLRLLAKDHWEAVVELGAYPGRLIHPNFRLAYLF